MPTEKADIFTLAKFGDLESFKEKFDAQLINSKSKHGSGLLHYAISGKQFDIALFLIEKGIDVNMTNSDGQTALHLIAVNQNVEVLKALIHESVDVNIRDKYGNNAMWTVVFNCKGKNYEFVDLLMEQAPDIKTKNKAGRSPIDFATQINDSKLIEILSRN